MAHLSRIQGLLLILVLFDLSIAITLERSLTPEIIFLVVPQWECMLFLFIIFLYLINFYFFGPPPLFEI
jgi:hypothetical protein